MPEEKVLVLVVTDDAESARALWQCLLIRLGCEVVVLKYWGNENNGERREKAWGKKKVFVG